MLFISFSTLFITKVEYAFKMDSDGATRIYDLLIVISRVALKSGVGGGENSIWWIGW